MFLVGSHLLQRLDHGTLLAYARARPNFQPTVVIGILARTITPHWLTNFVLAASGALGQPSASTSVMTCLPSIFLVGRRLPFDWLNEVDVGVD